MPIIALAAKSSLFLSFPEEGLDELRRVLVAYSWHNPRVGYCQSMNFLVAMLLLFMKVSFFCIFFSSSVLVVIVLLVVTAVVVVAVTLP